METLGKYFPNTPMLAAIVKISKVMEKEVFLREMEASLEHKFAKKPEVLEGNRKALRAAFDEVKKLTSHTLKISENGRKTLNPAV